VTLGAAALNLDDVAARVFIDLVIIVVVARLMGQLMRRIGQPAVIGEIFAGIMLGPTLLGAFPGNLDKQLFPTQVVPYLNIVAQIGLVIFMFIVGLELDLTLIRGKERTAAVVSVSSVALPFTLGFALAAVLFDSHMTVGHTTIDFLPFAVFLGASMSVTAFPVLARILAERGMYRTQIGTIALACAAVDDVLAWSLLAIAVAVVDASGALDFPRIMLEAIGFAAVMVLIVRPQLARLGTWYRKRGLTPELLAVILVGVFLSAYITERIGIHQIFGAFLFGAIMPREETAEMFHDILERIESLTVLLFLPVFFIVTGLSTNIRDIGLQGLWQLALILLVAIAGKFIGATAAARAQGLAPRQAASIGVLMNTRGLTELVILNVGLTKGVLDPSLFTLLVIMAIVTTVMTKPLLGRVYPEPLLQRDIAEAERAALGEADAFRVLAVVDDPASADALVDVAAQLAGGDPHANVVVTRFLTAEPPLELSSGLGGDLMRMTSSLEELHQLTARVEAAGATSAASSRFSNDIVHDLLAQIESTETDVVLIADHGDPQATATITALLRDAVTCDVAILTGADGVELGDRSIAATLTGGVNDGAVIEAAVRSARARHVPVRVLDGAESSRRTARYLAGIARRLKDAGVEVSADGGDPGLAIRPVADGDGAVGVNGSGLYVRAKPTLAGDDAADRLERLTAPAS
jgi:Kef-type K+ transport system membrane component KefB